MVVFFFAMPTDVSDFAPNYARVSSRFDALSEGIHRIMNNEIITVIYFC